MFTVHLTPSHCLLITLHSLYTAGFKSANRIGVLKSDTVSALASDEECCLSLSVPLCTPPHPLSSTGRMFDLRRRQLCSAGTGAAIAVSR